MSKDKFFKKINLRDFDRSINWRKKIANDQKLLAKNFQNQLGNEISCPICKNDESKLYVNVFKYPFHECINCNHLFQKTPLREETLRKLYHSEDKSVDSVQGKIYINDDFFISRVEQISRPKAIFATDLIDDQGLWVDIGAGVGDLIYSLKDLGWDAVGYESDKDEVEFGKKKGINLIHSFLEKRNIKYIVKNAKVVSAINVIEHLLNPIEFIFEITQNINHGSYILFEVPRFPSLSSLVNRCFPEFASRNIYSPDHLHLFSDKSIRILLDNAKLKVVSTWYFGQDIYELIGNTLTYGNFENHQIIDSMYNITNDLQKVIDKNKLSDTMLILAKKE